MLLRSVDVCGFRSIDEHVSIELGNPTILAGHNDAGKSAVLDSIAFLLGEYVPTDRDRTYAERLENGDLKRVAETVVEGTFELRATEQEELGLPRVTRLRRVFRESGVVLETLTMVPEDEQLRDIPAQKVDVLRFRLQSYGESTDGLKGDLVERLEAVAASSAKVEAWVAATSDLRRALPRTLRFDATSTQNPEEAILSTLKSSYASHLASDEIKGTVQEITAELETRIAADAEELREHIKAKCEDIGEITIRPTVQLQGGLRATEISARNARGEDVHLGQSGAGRSRRIALAVWEHQARLLKDSTQDIVLLYDEPDTHLDYAHQRGFMRILAEQVALPNVQIVVATHSMNLIDGVDISSVIHLWHEDSRTVASRITDDTEVGSHLGAIAASLGLRNTVLLHERLFVGVEGETESRAFPVLFKLATGRHLESCGIALWGCGNNDGALRFAEYLTKHDRQVLLVVDADSRDQKLFRDANLERCGLDPSHHLLEVGVREFEDTFSDAQWAACANLNWPRSDGEKWSEEHFQSHRDSKFSSKVEHMLREQGSVDISGKPQIMATLALGLQSADEVPQTLRDLFDELIRRAD